MISLVIINWRRTSNVERLVRSYSCYAMIREILVVCNSEGVPEVSSSEAHVVVIRASEDLGLYSRFAAASLARNRCILLADDDLLVPEATLQVLHAAWARRPEIVHGLHGRKVREGYTPGTVYGDVEVVLTRFALVDRRYCAIALSHIDAFEHLDAEPRGNGEDIILSFVAMDASGVLNRAHRLPHENIPDGCSDDDSVGPLAIHKRFPRHWEHRSQIVAICRHRFSHRRFMRLRTLVKRTASFFF